MFEAREVLLLELALLPEVLRLPTRERASSAVASQSRRTGSELGSKKAVVLPLEGAFAGRIEVKDAAEHVDDGCRGLLDVITMLGPSSERARRLRSEESGHDLVGVRVASTPRP